MADTYSTPDFDDDDPERVKRRQIKHIMREVDPLIKAAKGKGLYYALPGMTAAFDSGIAWTVIDPEGGDVGFCDIRPIWFEHRRQAEDFAAALNLGNRARREQAAMNAVAQEEQTPRPELARPELTKPEPPKENPKIRSTPIKAEPATK